MKCKMCNKDTDLISVSLSYKSKKIKRIKKRVCEECWLKIVEDISKG